jgi:nucleoside-diphosphate-sugar epimerase
MSEIVMPRIMLTGGSGFIGCQLARYALQRGHAVTVTSAVNTDAERQRVAILTRAGVEVIVAPLDDRAALVRALRGSDVVIHLAAAQHEAHAPEAHFERVNVEGTRTLLELAASSGIRRFVHGSTIGVYGSARDGELDEQSALAPDNPYGRTKAAAEDVVRSFASRIESCIVRISETYGPADLRLLKLFRAIERRRYVTLGRGTNEHQLIYVDDLAEGLLRAATLTPAVGETFVLAGAERLTTDDMVAAIAAALGQPRPGAHAPLWPFSLAATVLETTLTPFGIKPPLHRRRLDFFRKSFRFSTAKARELLDFRPAIPFVEGARRTAAWYRENGMLSSPGTAASSARLAPGERR